jgi:NAD(P)-dependent dehydrogenase (short-subunit alcohol dehydrogenase family)
MKTVLVIGASCGLGFEFVRQYRADGWRVIATTRSRNQNASLLELGADIVRLDVTNAHSFEMFANALEGIAPDVVVYHAAILGPQNEGAIPCATAEFDAVMQTNVLGALHAMPIVAPRLEVRSGKFAFLSSMMGSIASQVSTRRVVYRASKSALNAVVKTASIEWAPKGVTCLAPHTGWVKIDMGGADADIEASESVAGMRAVIAYASTAQNGHFVDYKGTPLTW